MPLAGDPIQVGWTIVVEDAVAYARFVRGTLTFASGETQAITARCASWDTGCSSTEVRVTDGFGLGYHERASGAPEILGCGAVCDTSVTLELTYDVDGVERQASVSGIYRCTF